MTSETPRARFLGAELRDAREARDIGVRQLAKQLGVGHATVVRWETGKKVPKTEDVASFLTAIGITGDERERLLELARQAEQPNWLTVGIPGIADELRALLEFERTASEFDVWSPAVIPGLLQTGDYARAIMGNRPMADVRVAMRVSRRDMLTRQDPVKLDALIGETALRQPITSPTKMAAQLRHLNATSELPNVTIQVVPSNTGWHPGLMGPFVILLFAKAKPIVHLERHRGSAFVFDEEDVKAYIDLAEFLRREMALSPEDSTELIADVINETETI